MKFYEGIPIVVRMAEASFDRACDEAYRLAVRKFGVDDCGHSDMVEGWEMSTCCIALSFTSYDRTSSEHVYVFSAHADKADD